MYENFDDLAHGYVLGLEVTESFTLEKIQVLATYLNSLMNASCLVTSFVIDYPAIWNARY